MSLKVNCPSCSKSYRVPAETAGKKLKCKACGAMIEVPLPEAELLDDSSEINFADLAPPEDNTPAAPAADPFPMSFDPNSSQRRSKPFPVKIAAMIGGAAMLVIGIFVAVAVFLGDGGNDDKKDENAFTLQPVPGTTPAWANEAVGQPPRPDRPTPPERNNPLTPDPLVPDETDRPDVPRFPFPFPEPENPRPDRPTPPESIDPTTDQPDPAIAWAVTPDPLAEAFEPYPRLDLNINDKFDDDLVIPATPSPFIAIGENSLDSHRRFVIDVRNGKPLWQLKGKKPDIKGVYTTSGENAKTLSPNGKHIAILGRDSNGTYAFIYSNDKDRSKLYLQLSEDRPSDQRLMFSSNDQMLYLERDSDEGRVVAYDLKSGEQAWASGTIKDARGFDDFATLSPGGRYLAFTTGGYKQKHINLLDTTNGQAVGRIMLEEGVSGCSGLSFSPDGSRLGAAFDSGKKVVLWDAATGERIAQADINTELLDRNVRLKRFMLIDNQHLACFDGDVFVDMSTGNAFSTYQGDNHYSKDKVVKMLHGNIGIRIEKETNSRNQKANRLGVADVDVAKLTKSLTALATGIDIVETNLPPLEQTLYSSASPGDFEFDPQAAQDNPVQITTGQTMRPNPKPVKIEFPTGASIDHGPGLNDTDAFRVTRPDDRGLALVHHPDGRLFQIHIQGKRGAKEIKLPAPMMPMWLSGDGKQMLGRSGRFRLNLVDIDSGNVLKSWRIKQEESSGSTQAAIVQAALVHGNRLWVRNNKSVACLIDTDTNTLIDKGRVCNSLDNMTADGRYLLTLARLDGGRSALQLIDTRTAVAVARYEFAQGTPRKAVLSHSTGKAAVVIDEGQTTRLQIIDLQNNELLHNNLMPTAQGSSYRRYALAWLDDRYLLIDTNVVDSQTGRHLWAYKTDAGTLGRVRVVGTKSGQTLWHCEPRRNGKKDVFLLAGSAPVDRAKRKASSNPDTAKPTTWLIGPGAKVRYELSGVRNDQAMRASIDNKLQAAGLTYDEQATFVLRITQSTESTSQDVQSLGLGGIQQGTITEQRETTEFQWLDETGKVLWVSRRTSSGGSSTGVVRVERGESAIDAKQREINERLQRGSPSSFTGPVLLTELIDSQLLGTSVLGTSGFQDIRPTPDE